jgi:hypothetical protein
VEPSGRQELQDVAGGEPVAPGVDLLVGADHVVTVVHHEPGAHVVLQGPTLDRHHRPAGRPHHDDGNVTGGSSA